MLERIELESLPNTRDLGGIPTEDGRCIQPKRLLRSGALAGISENDRRILQTEYHLRTVIDFRTEAERREAPDPELADVRYIANPIAQEQTMGISRERGGLEAYLAIEQDADELMASIYPQIVGSAFGRSQYAKFFEYLLEQKDGAVLWHCSAGKDRAGMGSALVLAALGANEDVIRKDYLKTNEYLAPFNDAICKELLRHSDTDEKKLAKVRTLLSVKEEYLDSAFSYIKKEYGSIDNYLKEGLGLTEEKLKKLKEMYLSPQ